jgi:hypothetical protein
MLELCAIVDPQRSIYGMCLGKNTFPITFRVLSKFESQIPQFFVV